MSRTGSSPVPGTNLLKDFIVLTTPAVKYEWFLIITTMKNRGATPRCFNRVPEGKKDA